MTIPIKGCSSLTCYNAWRHDSESVNNQRAVHLDDMGNKEGRVLFNDTLNTFYLRLYGVRHMVKDHSSSERRNPLPPYGYSFRLAAWLLLYASSHRQDNTYHSLCYTSRGALAGARNSQWIHHEGSIRRPIAPWANAHYGATSRSFIDNVIQIHNAR